MLMMNNEIANKEYTVHIEQLSERVKALEAEVINMKVLYYQMLRNFGHDYPLYPRIGDIRWTCKDTNS